MTTLPTYPAVLRATPEGQTLDQWTRFEFAPSMGVWRWESAQLDQEWTEVEAATQAGLFGPCSSVDTTAHTIAVWCEPWKAGETLRLLRGAGIGSAMSYLVVAERGRPCNETRLCAAAGASEPEAMGKLPAPKAEPTERQRRAIAHAREERREELEPLRLEVADAIGRAGWRRASPVVEEVLGHPVSGQRGAWWSEVGKRAAARIIEALEIEAPAPVLYRTEEVVTSAGIPEPSGVPAVETASTTSKERSGAEMPTSTKDRSAERTTEKKGHTVKVGHLGNDPELRFAPSGVAHCNFSIAVERPVVPGEWSGERTTDWYQVVCFKSLAENVAQSLGKGARVVVSGEAEVEHWTDKEGQPRTTKKIVADSVGAELRFATVEIAKPERRETVPVGAGAPAGDQCDEEPF